MADLMNRALVLLREGKPARLVERTVDEEKTFRGLGLLSSKPVLYVCNVEEASADKGNEFSQRVYMPAPRKRTRSPLSSPPRSKAKSPFCPWPTSRIISMP